MYLSLEHRVPVRHLSFMAPDTDDDSAELQRWGLALKALRERAGLSQEEAAAALEALGGGRRGATFTSQAWGPYERGKAKGLRTPSIQAKMAKALKASREDLVFEYQKLMGIGAPAPMPGLAERSAPTDWLPQTRTGRLVVTNDLLQPWAASGHTVIYSLDEWPRAGEGVVLVPRDGGPPLVKIYDGADAGTIRASDLSPALQSEYSREDYAAFRVIARLN